MDTVLLLQDSIQTGAVPEVPQTLIYIMFTAMTGAISALFAAVIWLSRSRIERCEKREDKLLDEDSLRTATVKEATATALKAAELTEKAVNASVSALNASQRNGEKLDAHTAAVSQLQSTLASVVEKLSGLQRTVEDLVRDGRRN